MSSRLLAPNQIGAGDAAIVEQLANQGNIWGTPVALLLPYSVQLLAVVGIFLYAVIHGDPSGQLLGILETIALGNAGLGTVGAVAHAVFIRGPLARGAGTSIGNNVVQRATPPAPPEGSTP